MSTRCSGYQNIFPTVPVKSTPTFTYVQILLIVAWNYRPAVVVITANMSSIVFSFIFVILNPFCSHHNTSLFFFNDNVFIVFLYFVFLLCFYLWNNTETVILLHWPHVSDCILCWPFGQYSSVICLMLCLWLCAGW